MRLGYYLFEYSLFPFKSVVLTHQHIHKGWCTNERNENADWQFCVRSNAAAQAISNNEENATPLCAEWNQGPVIRADRHAHKVRNQESYKTNHTRSVHHKANNK